MLTAVSNSTDERFRSLSSPASRAAAMLLLFYRISQGRSVLGDLSQGEKGEIEKERSIGDLPIDVVEDVHDDDGRHEPKIDLALQLLLQHIKLLGRNVG